MKTIFAYDPWRLVENELHKDDMRLSESMTSIGNGHMGMRGNFEERYSGDSHRGTYLAGVWFPDKTRVGWWKNGYPQYFGKVINAMNIISLRVRIDREDIDLFEDDVLSFQRVRTCARACSAANLSFAAKKARCASSLSASFPSRGRNCWRCAAA